MSSNTDCVLTLRRGRQHVAVLLEVQHEVAGQDWLRGERVAENLLNLRLVDLHRRGDAAAHLSGRVRMIEQDRLLRRFDRDGARAAVGIGQHHEQRLAAGTRCQEKKNQDRCGLLNDPANDRANALANDHGLTSITKLVPRTARIAVGVLTFMAPGVLRAISPEIIETVPRFMSVSIEPLKSLELNL